MNRLATSDASARRTILHKAQKSVAIAGVAALLGLGLWQGSEYAVTHSRQQAQSSQALLGAQQDEYALLQIDLANMETHLADYRRLQQQGLVGAPRREEWVEQVLASHQALELPPALTYQLGQPQPLHGTDLAENPTEVGVSATNQSLRHDLQISQDGVHEVDVLRLLDHLQNHVSGRFRVQSCEFLSPGTEGFNSRCVLRFFTLPEPAASVPSGDA